MGSSITTRWLFGLLVFSCFFVSPVNNAAELFGYISAQARSFPQSALFQEQSNSDYSVSGELEYYNSWADGQQSLLFKPFFRIDNTDDERTHIDIQEFIWSYSVDEFKLKAGVGKVFWGATEFYHLVDIVNQTDGVESIDGESKLGQPMLTMSYMNDLGETEFFLLPGFRERTYPGIDGRLQLVPGLNFDNPIYESSKEDRHIDWAVRWSHTLKDIDVGIGYFKGTSRDPVFIPDPTVSEDRLFVPFYSQIEQFSLDLQAIYENTLWKFESLYRSGQSKSFVAATGGIEYSFIGILDSRADLGLVVEYMYDERGEVANHFQQDDVGVGLRFVLNDTQSSEILVGLIQDINNQEKVWSLESSRRFGENWKLKLEGYVFRDVSNQSVLTGIKNDDYISLEILRYF